MLQNRDSLFYIRTVFGGSDSSGLSVIDISEPRHPAITGYVEIRDRGSDVAVSGDHAYVVGSKGLHIVDVSVPISPSIVALVETSSYVLDVSVTGRYALLAANTDGLKPNWTLGS